MVCKDVKIQNENAKQAVNIVYFVLYCLIEDVKVLICNLQSCLILIAWDGLLLYPPTYMGKSRIKFSLRTHHRVTLFNIDNIPEDGEK